MRFFLILVGLEGILPAVSAEIVLRISPNGTSVTAELFAGGAIDLGLRIAPSDGEQSMRPESIAGSAGAEGAKVEMDRSLSFPAGEQIQVMRRAVADGNTVKFAENWRGSLPKGAVTIQALMSFADLRDAEVRFLDSQGLPVGKDAVLSPSSMGKGVRGLRCSMLKLSGWKGRDLIFRFGNQLDCYLFCRNKDGQSPILDLRIMVQRASVTSGDLDWSLEVTEAQP